MHQFAIIKKCLDTVDARYKREDFPVVETSEILEYLPQYEIQVGEPK
jgi:hypothetical protein